jgi:hypothetical protein
MSQNAYLRLADYAETCAQALTDFASTVREIDEERVEDAIHAMVGVDDAIVELYRTRQKGLEGGDK